MGSRTPWTSGPWTVGTWNAHTAERYDHWVLGSDYQLVAMGCCQLPGLATQAKQQAKANAELVVLAPEMADAIELYRHWIELDATVVGELQEKMRGLSDKLRAIGGNQ